MFAGNTAIPASFHTAHPWTWRPPCPGSNQKNGQSSFDCMNYCTSITVGLLCDCSLRVSESLTGTSQPRRLTLFPAYLIHALYRLSHLCRLSHPLRARRPRSRVDMHVLCHSSRPSGDTANRQQGMKSIQIGRGGRLKKGERDESESRMRGESEDGVSFHVLTSTMSRHYALSCCRAALGGHVRPALLVVLTPRRTDCKAYSIMYQAKAIRRITPRT